MSDASLGARTLLGHLLSPLLARGLLLEHGCEKTHLDFFAEEMRAAGVERGGFGWVSLQVERGEEACPGRNTTRAP